jgi:CheY-like chemotaxis protein
LGKEKDIKIPPVIIYTGKELTRQENSELQQFTHSIIIKGVKSEERLLDETALFLHRVVSDLPADQKKMITNLHDKEKCFEKKNLLVVDDDMRNLFALTQILEEKGMNVLKAEDGKKAVDALQNGHHIDLVLMDIMMPVMDGYEAMHAIRKEHKFNRLPIIALTAKAMKEDREKCIAAGANDYLTKPVNVDKLLSLMRVWLYK